MHLEKTLKSLADTIRLRYLGFGLIWAWIFGVWFTPAVFDGPSPLAHDLTWIVSLLCSAAAMVALSLRPHAQKPMSSRWILPCCLVMGASTLVLASPAQLPVLVAASVCSGVASGFLWVHWGETFSALTDELTEACVPASALLVVVLVPLAAGLSMPFSAILAACLPPASGLMLLTIRGEDRLWESFPTLRPAAERQGVTRSVVVIGLCSAVCSMASAFVLVSVGSGASGAVVSAGGATGSTAGSPVFVIAGALGAALISLLTVSFARRIDFLTFCQWMIPVLVASLCMAVAGVEALSPVAAALAGVVCFSTDCLFWILFSTLARKGACTPSMAFGFSRACIQLGCAVGSCMATVAPRLGMGMLHPVLLLICACVVAFPVIVRQHEVVLGFTQPPAEPAGEAEPAQEDRVADLARAYGLSPREAQVLELLAKGRSVTYMRDVLFISKGTIDTHVKHIYAKMAVHSRQELLDLVESATTAAAAAATDAEKPVQ